MSFFYSESKTDLKVERNTFTKFQVFEGA